MQFIQLYLYLYNVYNCQLYNYDKLSYTKGSSHATLPSVKTVSPTTGYTTSLSSLDSLTISTTQSPTTSASATSSRTVPIVLGAIGGTLLMTIIMIIIVVILRKHKSEHLIY